MTKRPLTVEKMKRYFEWVNMRKKNSYLCFDILEEVYISFKTILYLLLPLFETTSRSSFFRYIVFIMSLDIEKARTTYILEWREYLTSIFVLHQYHDRTLV